MGSRRVSFKLNYIFSLLVADANSGPQITTNWWLPALSGEEGARKGHAQPSPSIRYAAEGFEIILYLRQGCSGWCWEAEGTRLAPNSSRKDKAENNLQQEPWHSEPKTLFQTSCRCGWDLGWNTTESQWWENYSNLLCKLGHYHKIHGAIQLLATLKNALSIFLTSPFTISSTKIVAFSYHPKHRSTLACSLETQPVGTAHQEATSLAPSLICPRICAEIFSTPTCRLTRFTSPTSLFPPSLTNVGACLQPLVTFSTPAQLTTALFPLPPARGPDLPSEFLTATYFKGAHQCPHSPRHPPSLTHEGQQLISANHRVYKASLEGTLWTGWTAVEVAAFFRVKSGKPQKWSPKNETSAFT